ncbi:MAG: S9 family peptidase [Pseudomonadota bacterium]
MRLACAVIISFSTVLAAPLAQAEEPLSFEDVFRLEMAADPQISADGGHVVYVRRSNDIMTDRTRSDLWTIDFEGRHHRPLVTGSEAFSSPRWAPDGSRVAFIAQRETSAQLRSIWLEGGQITTLAVLPAGANGLTWSPDGRWIAFTMFTRTAEPQVDIGMPAKPPGAEWAEASIIDETIQYEFDGVGELPAGGAQVYIVSAEGGAPIQLTEFDSGAIGAVNWSPDSRELFFSLSSAEADDFDFRESDIHAVDLSGNVRQITDSPGAESAPALSPDGEVLAYLGGPNRGVSHQDNNLYMMDVSGGETRELLAELDRPIAQIAWDGDGRGLWLRYDDRGKTVLAHMTRSGRLETVSDSLGGLTFGRPYTTGAFSVSRNGRFTASAASAYDLANIGVGTRRNGMRTLTDINSDVLGLRELARIEEITWPSSADGREIQGWIAYPPGFDPQQSYPMILEIHGGPHTAYGPIFSGEVQLFAAAGYVVLYTNPRGSTSYGEDFANLIDKNYPGEDVDDLLSGVDALVERGFIDPQRLFVTGGSGGGVLTAQLIGVDDRFAAAAVGKPVINWTSFALAADIGPVIYKYWFGVTPWEDPEQYWRRSPLSLVGNVTTPSLVFVGAEDRRTPVFEAEQYYNALQIRGIESRLVRIPDTYHGIADSRPSRLLQKVGHILAWFEAYDPGRVQEE